jgi:cysteine desulfurase
VANDAGNINSLRQRRSYLDHAANSPMSPGIRSAYIEALGQLGNPASTHADGQGALERLEGARERIAASLGGERVEVVLTSGGTESINIAVKGIFWARQVDASRPVVLLPRTEHHATFEACEWLRDHQGAELVWLEVDREGVLHAETLAQAIAEHGAHRIALITFLLANNEVGSIQPVRQLAAIASAAGVPSHVDAVAALGQMVINFRDIGASALSVSAHKIGGPVGVGALLLARHTKIESLLHGGAQQRGRSGTQDAAGAVAFAAALDYAERVDIVALTAARDRLIAGVLERVPDAVARGAVPTSSLSSANETSASFGRLPGNAHFTFPGCQGDSLLFLLDEAGISVSTGSACQAGVTEISHVLIAMGLPEDVAAGALRMTLGGSDPEADVDHFLLALPAAVAGARRAGLS